MSFIVDFNFLRQSDSTLTPKEAAIVSIDKNYIGHWILSPPEDYNSLPLDVKFKNYQDAIEHHGLHWSDGTTSIESFEKILNEISEVGDKIYVYGEYNAYLVNKIIQCNKVIDLKQKKLDFFSNPIRNDYYCYHHGLVFNEKYKNCALANALSIKEQLNENKEIDDKVIQEQQQQQQTYIFFTNNE